MERDAVIAAIAGAAAARSFAPIVITGDVHASFVWDLKTDWDDGTDRSVVATELVGTSISSEGDTPIDEDGGFTTKCGNRNGNAHNHLFDNRRRYVVCRVTPDRWQAGYRILPPVKDSDATASTLTSFVVEYGHPGAQLAGDCVNAASG